MEGISIIETKELDGLKANISELTSYVKILAKQVKINDPLMTSLEVQDYLKKGSTWVDANKHEIGCSKVGGEWRFRKSVVDAYVNSTYHKNN